MPDNTRRVLIIVENLPVPFDRRVWQEATTLRAAGFEVSVICPTGKGHDAREEVIDGVHIFRHPLPPEGNGPLGYAREYAAALFWQTALAWKVFFKRGFDVIQACNPPDLIVLVALPFKLLGRKFVFDHHDLNPELYRVKFGREDFLYRCLLAFERLTFRLADVSIATNESYRRIAVERGGMAPDRVFVVRSGPDLSRLAEVPAPEPRQAADGIVVGYVGIMGDQDGIDGLLRIARHVKHDLGRTDIDFLLIGDGTELARLQQYARELDVADRVRFTGYLRGPALLQALAGIDIGAVPDPKNDYNDKCTMNKIMEYMAMAKPVVQYDLTEGRFSAGAASLYARPGDEADFAAKLIHLADDADLRRRLGGCGRRRIEDALDWRYEAPSLLAAYRCVFQQPRLQAARENGAT